MNKKATKLHVLIDAKRKVLAVHEAPPAVKKASWTVVRPAKGQSVVEVEVTLPFKELKSMKQAVDLVTPYLKSAVVVNRG